MLEGETCIAATETSTQVCDTKTSDLTFLVLQLRSVGIADKLGKKTWSVLSIHAQSAIVNDSFSVSVHNENKTNVSKYTILSSFSPMTDDKLLKLKSSNISVYLQTPITIDHMSLCTLMKSKTNLSDSSLPSFSSKPSVDQMTDEKFSSKLCHSKAKINATT